MGEGLSWLGEPLGTFYALAGLVTTGQFTASMLLALWRLPHRSRFGAKLVVVLSFAALATLAGTWWGRVSQPQAMGDLYYQTMLLVLAAAMTVAVVAGRWLFDASFWTTTTCVCIGATLTSLLGSVGELWRQAAAWAGMAAATPWPALLGTIAAYAAFYLLFVRRVRRGRMLDAGGPAVAALSVAITFVVFAFDMTSMRLPDLRAPVSLVIVLRCVHVAVCVFMLAMGYELLYNRWLRQDVAAMRRMGEDERRQFDLVRSQTRLLQRDLDGLRVRVLQSVAAGHVDREAMAELSREAAVFDAAVRTGNEALDTILTEKGLACQGEGIQLGCVADGAALSFVEPADLYWLFGSLLDNAMEAARQTTEQDKRAIDLTVRRQGDMALVHVENYFGGQVRIVNGRPVGGGSHSYGLGSRAVSQIAASYGGSATFSLADDTFRVDVLLPLPQGGTQASARPKEARGK